MRGTSSVSNQDDDKRLCRTAARMDVKLDDDELIAVEYIPATHSGPANVWLCFPALNFGYELTKEQALYLAACINKAAILMEG